jgi:hypothetical protein
VLRAVSRDVVLDQGERRPCAPADLEDGGIDVRKPTRLAAGRLSFLPLSESGEARRGRYEEHYLKGWPEGKAHGLSKCPEHPTCAIRVTYISVGIVRQVLFDGGGPFPELG